MADIYTTNQLIGVVQTLIRPVSWLLDRYFPTITTFDTEEVHVDVIPGKRRVIPLVSPFVEGKIVDALAQRVNTLKPAYAKAKTPFQPNRALKRTAGEQIGGSLTAQQRHDLALTQHLEDLIGMVVRRKEVMASEALRTGKVTLVGDGYPSVTVDFQRNAAHTIAALSGGTNHWAHASSKPLRNLAAWATLGLQNGGANLVDVIMGADAWAEFSEHSTVEKRLLQINAAGTDMNRTIEPVEGGVYKGTVDGMNIFVYSGWYIDPVTGTETEIWPSKAVCVTSTQIEGEQLHGAIQDPRAGLAAMEFFPKMWMEEDPAMTWMMIQSAPLVAPRRPDAAVYCPDVVTA